MDLTPEEEQQLRDLEELDRLQSEQANAESQSKADSFMNTFRQTPIIGPAAGALYDIGNSFDGDKYKAQQEQLFGMPYEDITVGDRFVNASKDTARAGIEMGASMIPAGWAARAPAIVAGGASFLGGLAGRFTTEQTGLRKEGTMFDDYMRVNPFTDPLGTLTNPIVTDLVLPAASSGYGAMKDWDTTWLRRFGFNGGPGLIKQKELAAAKFDVANADNPIANQFQAPAEPGVNTATRNMEMRTNTDPALKSGAFGASRVIDDINDPNFGTFTGQAPKSGLEMSQAMDKNLDSVMTSRDVALQKTDELMQLHNQSNPGAPVQGITAQELTEVPVNVLGPKGPQPVPLQQAADGLWQGYVSTGMKDKAAGVKDAIDNFVAPRFRDNLLQPKTLGVTETKKMVDDLDDVLKDLGKYESPDTSPQLRAFAEGKKEALGLIREGYNNTLQSLLGRVKQAVPSAPSPDIFTKANELFNTLKPYRDQMMDWSKLYQKRAGNVLPQRPQAEPPSNVNVLNPLSSQGLPAQMAGRMMSPSSADAAEAATYENLLNLSRVNNEAPGNVADIARLRAQGAPDTVTPINSRPLSQAMIMGGAGARQADRPELSLPSLIQEARADQPELSPVKAPSALTVDLNPPKPAPKEGFTIPRNMNILNPQGVANLLTKFAAPQDVMPLMGQWRRVAATGDKKQMAQFLGLISERYPDFPLQRGAVTGLASEFDIGDGKVRLFNPNDMMTWENQINMSQLREDEKAFRVSALRRDGLVVPFSVKLNNLDQEIPTVTPEEEALKYTMQNYKFSKRMNTPFGTRRIEQ